MPRPLTSSRRATATSATRSGLQDYIAYWQSRPNLLKAALVVMYPMIVFLFTYYVDHVRPGALWQNGWYGIWYDQGQYMKMLQSIPGGSLGPFTYPPMYPFLAWLASPVYPSDPFLPLNLAMFEVFTILSWSVFRRYIEPGLAFTALIVLCHTSVKFFEVPWTSTVTAAGISVLMWIISSNRVTTRWGMVAGLWVGLIYGARIGDAALAGALIIVAVASAERRNGLRFAAAAALTAGAVVGAVLLVTHRLTGLWFGHYFEAIRSQGFSLLSAPFRLYGYFIDAFTFHHETNPFSEPVWMVLPGLLLVPAGLRVLWLRQRRMAIAVAVLCLSWLITYGPFVAVTALSLKYGSVHYAKALFPALLLCIFSATGSFATAQHVVRTVCATLLLFIVLIAAATLMAPELIDSSRFTFTVSHNHQLFDKALDRNLATRWDTGTPQAPGMSVDLHFDQPTWISHVSLNTTLSPNGFPRTLSILRSDDGSHWFPISYSANQSIDATIGDYYIDPLRTRGLRLRLDKADADWWSIHELTVYGW